MRVPSVGDRVKEEGKYLEVIRVFNNNAGVKVVEYVDHNGLHGCVLPEYWYKKEDEHWNSVLEKLDGQAGSGAPS